MGVSWDSAAIMDDVSGGLIRDWDSTTIVDGVCGRIWRASRHIRIYLFFGVFFFLRRGWLDISGCRLRSRVSDKSDLESELVAEKE